MKPAEEIILIWNSNKMLQQSHEESDEIILFNYSKTHMLRSPWVSLMCERYAYDHSLHVCNASSDKITVVVIKRS